MKAGRWVQKEIEIVMQNIIFVAQHEPYSFSLSMLVNVEKVLVPAFRAYMNQTFHAFFLPYFFNERIIRFASISEKMWKQTCQHPTIPSSSFSK